MSRPTRTSSLRLALGCLLVAAAIAAWNRDHRAQRGVYEGQYLQMARYFAGEAPAPRVVSYPLWGYPALLATLPAPEATSVALQVALGVATLLALHASVACWTRSRRLLAVLVVAAVPWWSLASVRLADPWSAIFAILGVLALAHASSRASWRLALASGVAFGVALNFRSDLLPVLVALPLVLALLAPRVLRSSALAIALALATALLLLVPWGLFRVYHGAPFGLTSTNSGMVLYNSLGFTGNAWGIAAADELRGVEVERALGPGQLPTSPEGDRWLRAQMLRAVRERPGEFARKIAFNLRAIVTFGFYAPEVEPHLQPGDALRYEALKELLKLRAGAMVNQADVELLRRAGVWSDELRSTPARLWLAAGLPVVNALLSATFLLAVIAASLWLVAFDRRWLRRAEVAIPLAALWSVWAFLALVWYQPRNATLLYPLGIPVLLAALDGVRERLGGRLRPTRSEPQANEVHQLAARRPTTSPSSP